MPSDLRAFYRRLERRHRVDPALIELVDTSRPGVVAVVVRGGRRVRYLLIALDDLPPPVRQALADRG